MSKYKALKNLNLGYAKKLSQKGISVHKSRQTKDSSRITNPSVNTMRYNSQGNESGQMRQHQVLDEGSFLSMKSRGSQLSRVTQPLQNPFILDGQGNAVYPINGNIKTGNISLNQSLETKNDGDQQYSLPPASLPNG